MSAHAAQAMLSTALRSLHLRKAQMGKPPVYINVGDRFGSLVVIREMEPRVRRGLVRRMIECRCTCGNVKSILLNSLRHRGQVSCGCLTIKANIERLTKHGLFNNSAYGCWHGMIRRCSSAGDASYKNYGGRGISVCPQWQSFEVFLNDMGPRPSETHSIDRYPDQDGNYEPGNCRWATQKEQMRNTRHNRMITWNGETKCVTEWSEITGLSTGCINYRLKIGLPVDLVLTRHKYQK